MTGLSIANNFDPAKLARLADGLVVAVAVSLPWSTSATAILVALWLFVLVPTLRWADMRRELATPAGGLPVLLVALGLAGMLWADVTVLARWKGLDSFLKLAKKRLRRSWRQTAVVLAEYPASRPPVRRSPHRERQIPPALR